MIKNFSTLSFRFFVFLIFSANSGFGQTSAEDLWGNRIDIQSAISGKTPAVIVPFSTSNCGYCLMDGYFIEKNYIGNNDKFGGNSYHMSLFNPQLDIYTFQKHFKWKGEIITSPTGLHMYHEDGFPSLLAFKNGKQVLKEFYNYAAFDTLKTLLWDTNTRLIPTGEKHLADAFIYENQADASVIIYPKDAKIPDEAVRMAEKLNLSCKHINELTPKDLVKHIKLKGGFDFKTLRDFFPVNSVPVGFKENRIILGEHSFNYDSTGIYCCFPSPFNKEKYIVLEQNNPDSRLFWHFNYVDYIIFSGNEKEAAQRLLYGHFNKETDYQWKFDDNTAFSDGERSNHCETICKVPAKRQMLVHSSRQIPVMHKNMNDRDEWTIGNDHCRFPEITADSRNNIWITWEENGDIGLASIDLKDRVKTWFVENDESDSYNPQVVMSGNEVWIFYLNNQDGYYRLYGKSFDGIRFSDAILVSEQGPFDAITPDVATDNSGEITIVWSGWKANYRFLMYRQIKSGVITDITQIKAAPPLFIKDYTNAWYPSIIYDRNKELMGAWNQHYPATFGVCGGKLNDTSISITQTAKQMDDCENGGYPYLFSGTKKQLFVVWESFAWDVYNEHKPQRIKLSEFNYELNKWTIGKVISMDEQTMLCQTPAGACDTLGNKIVVWSGRTADETHPWGLYMVTEKNGTWDKPVKISDKNDNDRHPKMIIDHDGMVWISCHSGTGDNMKVKVIRLQRN